MDIREFWLWFIRHAVALRAEHVSTSLTSELNRRVRSLGVPAWELGPDPKGLPDSAYFCLSDNGDAEKFELISTMLLEAPSLPHWRFTRFRQKKDWKGTLEINRGDRTIEVDCTKWRFSFSKSNNGPILDICIPDNQRTQAGDTRSVAFIFILNEIGEEDFKNMFFDFDIEDWSACAEDTLFMSFAEFRSYWASVLRGTDKH